MGSGSQSALDEIGRPVRLGFTIARIELRAHPRACVYVCRQFPMSRAGGKTERMPDAPQRFEVAIRVCAVMEYCSTNPLATIVEKTNPRPCVRAPKY
jgi:hypothetical protein